MFHAISQDEELPEDQRGEVRYVDRRGGVIAYCIQLIYTDDAESFRDTG